MVRRTLYGLLGTKSLMEKSTWVMALPLQIEQTSPSDATIGIGCDGVAKPTIYLDSVNDKGRGKVKVQGCMQDYIGLGGGYNCRMGK